ncbi:MAG: hypothetical protein V3575_04810 [Candidatus Absconditabacteria bacterium]
MKKLLIGILGFQLFVGCFSLVLAQDAATPQPSSTQNGDSNNAVGGNDSKDCIKLNTDVPYVTDGNRCIPKSESGKIFPILMGGLSKFIVNAILIVSFIMLVAGGMLISVSGFSSGSYNKGKELIMKVVVGIILLGTSSLILYIINPNFFR